MSERESVYFYILHKCASSLFATYALKNLTGLTHRDYAGLIYTGSLKDEVTFEKHGYVYGPIRPSTGSNTPVRHLLVDRACQPEFVRDKLALFMVRDPRDVLVSGYYSFSGSHKISRVAEIAQSQQRRRALLNQITLDDYAVEHASTKLEHFESILRIASACERGTLLRYEDMIHDWPAFAKALTTHVEIEPAVLDEIYKRSRPQETINEGKHRRSGQTEQFRTELKPETVKKLNEILAPVIEHLNYPF